MPSECFISAPCQPCSAAQQQLPWQRLAHQHAGPLKAAGCPPSSPPTTSTQRCELGGAAAAGEALCSIHHAAPVLRCQIDGDVATLGVTNYAQEQLGDVVYVGLPEVGATFEEGDAIAQVESVKAASDVYAVMSGEVVEVNSNLESNPELVNSSPEEDGWFVKLKVTSQPTGEVLDAEAYAALVESA